MNPTSAIFILSTLIIVFLSNAVQTSRESDQYVDTLLHISLQNELRNAHLDPSASMGTFEARAEERQFPSRVTVTADYSNGTLSGLSQVYRMGDCTNTTMGGNVTIKCILSFQHLTALYDVKVKYGRMPTVKAKANVTFTGAVLDMEINGTRQNGPYPMLRRLLVDSLGRMKIQFTGLAHLSRQQRLLKDGVVKHVPTFTLGVLYGPFLNALGASVNRTPLPINTF